MPAAVPLYKDGCACANITKTRHFAHFTRRAAAYYLHLRLGRESHPTPTLPTHPSLTYPLHTHMPMHTPTPTYHYLAGFIHATRLVTTGFAGHGEHGTPPRCLLFSLRERVTLCSLQSCRGRLRRLYSAAGYRRTFAWRFALAARLGFRRASSTAGLAARRFAFFSISRNPGGDKLPRSIFPSLSLLTYALPAGGGFAAQG